MSQGLSKGVMIAIAAHAIRIPMGAAEDTSTAQVRGRGGLVPAGSFAVSTEERKPLMQKGQDKRRSGYGALLRGGRRLQAGEELRPGKIAAVSMEGGGHSKGGP